MATVRKEKFVPDAYYHIYTRTILNIPEFQDNQSAARIAQAFLLANSTKSTEAFQFLRNNKDEPIEKAIEIARSGEKLVDALCYVIMPDHYHLLLKERSGDGIIRFISKCNTSIAKYINIKKDRSGPLFESRFKSKHIKSNNYLLHLSLYIHLNPLDFIKGRAWREHELKNWPSAKNQLLIYPWSSLKHYLDDNFNDPIISGEQIIKEQFSNKKDYEDFLKDWSVVSFEQIKDLTID